MLLSGCMLSIGNELDSYFPLVVLGVAGVREISSVSVGDSYSLYRCVFGVYCALVSFSAGLVACPRSGA